MKSEVFSKFLFYTVCAGIIFFYGLAVEKYQIFPYEVIYYFKNSATQVYKELRVLAGLKPVHFLQKARYGGNGVTHFEQDQAAPGLTLISGYYDGDNGLRLMRLDGSLVQDWPVRFSDFFPNPEHIRPKLEVPVTDWNVDIHGAVVLPDGSVVFNFEYGGMVKLDRCGTLRWTVPSMTHHSIDQSEDGGFWVPGRRFVEDRSAFPLIEAPYFEDTIMKISDDGEVLKEISVPGLFFKNNLQAILLANGIHRVRIPDELELVHVNDIEELRSDFADRFPQFVAGDLLLSLRDLNLIMLVDPTSEEVRWYQTGPWIRQHDPDFQTRGTITIFNNNSDDTKTGDVFGGSNIIEIHPKSGRTTIKYGEQPNQNMFSNIRGKHQVLNNGNILITEFTGGRAFEVNSSGDIVWEFVNRFDEDEIAEVADAIRYPEDYFTVDDWACEQGYNTPIRR